MIKSGVARFFLFFIIILSVVSSFASETANASEKMNQTNNRIPEVELLFCKGQSILPVLLTTGQIDGYVAWQPYLALAEESDIGKVVALSRDFPPNGLWHNHPCCVLVASNGILQNYPDSVVTVSAILLAGDDCAKENPGSSGKGHRRVAYGGSELFRWTVNAISPESIFHRSLPLRCSPQR